MRVLVLGLCMVAVAVAGCVSSEDGDTDGVEQPENTVSTHPDELLALLDVSATEGHEPLELVIDYDVFTTFDQVEWSLILEDKARFTNFHMGSGGLEKLPGQRNMSLAEGTYVVTLDVASGNATSQAFATIVVDLDPDACNPAPEYVVVGAAGEQHYVVGEGEEVWQESTGDDELQTPESCPNGPHDTQVK